MVGYEDALAYGVGWKNQDESFCDMYQVSGHYPAVYGWDIGDIHRSVNLDTVPFDDIVSWIQEIHIHGGINTISWHMDNPVNGNSSWDNSKIAKEILPGGNYHKAFLEKLDLAAAFFKKCKIGDTYIPIIFRPFHEHNGNWFWWGRGNFEESEYIDVYRFTADYLKHHHDIHHLIYAYSPDRSRLANPTDSTGYFWGYPGDDYVDILGIDNYHDVRVHSIDSLNITGARGLRVSVEMVYKLAEERGKVAALTETGAEGIKDSQWFTKRLLEPITGSENKIKLAYVLMWRNANTKHHYMVYPGHMANKDFNLFINDPATLSLDDVGKNFEVSDQ